MNHYLLVYRALNRLLIGTIAGFLLLAAATAYPQDAASAQKILVIHDASDLDFWRQSFDTSLHSFVTENGRPNRPLRLSIEYTGVNQPADGQRPDTLIEFLKERQVSDPAHVVISVLPPSARFLDAYGGEIFPGVPRIYLTPEFRNVPTNGVGSREQVYTVQGDFDEMTRENLRLISQIFPQLTNLLVLSGSNSHGLMQQRQVRDALEEVDFAANVEFSAGLPINELSRLLQAAPEGTAIILVRYRLDTDGYVFSTQDVLSEITSTTAIPVFSFFDSVYGRGIVGGYMSRASSSAEQVGKTALALLYDEPVPTPVLPFNYLFDGSELDRVGIDRDLLPPDRVIEFETFSLWRTYRSQVIVGILVILFQALLIFALYISLRKQRSVETALKEQAQDLSVQKKLFESVINSIPDAIVITHIDRTIYAANPSTRDVFGFEPKQLMGKKASDLIRYRDDKQRQQEQAMLESQDEVPTPIILQFKKRNGDTFSGETIGTKIISSEGEELGYFSLVRDITRRLAEEQEQQQSQKMQALGNLVGGIAHDFNNVLGVITAYAELLGFDENSEEGKASIGKIIKATHRGGDLCNQIMSFSRDMSVEQQQLNLMDVAKEFARLLSATIPSKICLALNYYGNDFPVFANFTQL